MSSRTPRPLSTLVSGRLLYLVVVTAILGCAASSAEPGTRPPPRNAKVLTAAEIAINHADANSAYDAIARLRPNWLASHGAMSSDAGVNPFASVWVDGQLLGELSTLRGIPAYQVEDMRYYDITEAGGKFGLRAGTGGAIEIRSKVR
jgi:hypothetical protein